MHKECSEFFFLSLVMDLGIRIVRGASLIIFTIIMFEFLVLSSLSSVVHPGLYLNEKKGKKYSIS